MNTLLDYIRILLLSVGGMLVSCTVLIVMSEQSNGTLAGKQSWIFFSLIWFACSVLFVVVSRKGKIPFSFSLPDALALAMLAFMLIAYPWKLNPAPDKLTIALLLTAFWFLLRIVLVTYPFLFSFFLFIYVFTGGAEAVWGIAQAFHWLPAGYDPAVRMSGSFYSAEAYSGYLAMMLPLSLSMSCYYRNCRKLQWWRATTWLYYTATASGILILIALIWGAGRTAWMAALISSVWVVWVRLAISRKIKEKWHLNPRIFRAASVSGFILLLVTAGCIGLLRNPDVREKIPLWRTMSVLAAEKPWLGTGMGGFPNAVNWLAAVPENRNPVRITEGVPVPSEASPFHASNEYLQLWMEHGLVGLILFLLLLGVCFYRGLKNRQWGACGALLSLAVFSFISDPLQQPTFLVTLTFFLVICLVNYQDILPPRVFYRYKAEPEAPGSDRTARKHFLRNLGVILFTALLTAATYSILAINKKIYRQTTSPVARQDASDIPDLYPRYGHYPEFFCEYAQELYEAQAYRASSELLTKALHYCRHPALYDLMAQNLQQTGQYRSAEEYLLRAVSEHPERLNSYYLLAKLYSLPDYYHPDKMKQMAHIVLQNNRVIYLTLDKRKESEMQALLQTSGTAHRRNGR